MTNQDDKRTETESTITIEGDLILESDFITEKSLFVKGRILGKDGITYNINARDIDARNINARNINARNINARNINARNINAWNINAWNIICETRKKKSKKATTKARIFITEKSKLERKMWD